MSMEENNWLPSLDDNEISPEARSYLLDPSKDYPEPYYLLEFNGVPFSPLGGIQAISGQKKNGKSFVLTQLMAAVLGQDSERVKKYLPGLTVPQRTIDHLGHLPRVLYCDTEMEELNSAKVLRRVHWLCEWDIKRHHDRFDVLWLRTVERDEATKESAHEKRFRLIREVIDGLKPDIVFIDGVRDIIGDFNNNEESAALVLRLMSLAQKKGICIWNALHMNPRPGNDDESKMRGHLGTELGNKVTDTLVSIKKKTASGVIFTVKQQDARGKDMDDWRFEVTDDAGALGIPQIFAHGQELEVKKEPKGDEPAEIRDWIETAKTSLTFPMSAKDVKKLIFAEIGGQKNTSKQSADIQTAKQYGYLVESEQKSGGYPMLDLPEDLPF